MRRSQPIRCAAASAVLAVLAACGGDLGEGETARARSAILGGEIALDDHAVTGIGNGELLHCTGALVSPRVILTAAHCLGPPALHLDFDPTKLSIFFGATMAGPGEWVQAAHATKAPSVDLALVLLADRAPSWAVPLPISPEPPIEGSVVRIVGFGPASPAEDFTRVRRAATASISAVEPEILRVQKITGLPCHGDSGGPALAGGAIAGITSRGNLQCDEYAIYSRTDTLIENFIEPYIAASRDSFVNTGARCYFDDQCVSKRCQFPSDSPQLGYCTETCASDAGCGDQMYCGADRTCLYPLPSPGAAGSLCETADDCSGRLCVAAGEERNDRVCSAPCAPAAESSCPSNLLCTRDPEPVARFVCLPPPSCACSNARAKDVSSLWFLGLLLILGARLITGLEARRAAATSAIERTKSTR